MSSSPIQLHEYLQSEYIVDLHAKTKKDALQELCKLVSKDARITDAGVFRKAIFDREELVSTGIGVGVAIPHVKIPEVVDYVIAVGRRSEGIQFDSLDGQPVNLIFLIGASDTQTSEFVRMLARIVRLVKEGGTRNRLLEAGLPDPFMEIIQENDGKQG